MSVLARPQQFHEQQQAVVLSSDSESEDVRPLAARLSDVQRGVKQAAGISRQMPTGTSTQTTTGVSPGRSGRKRGRAQQASPDANRQPAVRRQRAQQQQQQGRQQQDEAGPSQPAHPRRRQLQQEAQEAVVDLTASDSDDEVLIMGASGPTRQLGGNAAAVGGRSASASAPLLRHGVPLAALRTPVRAPAAPPPPAASPKGASCAVCMERLREPSCGPCGHIFCKQCLTESIKKLKKCPTCRRGFQVRQIHRVYLPEDS